MASEASCLLKEIRKARNKFKKSKHLSLISGMLRGKRVAYITSGIGVVNAAHAVTLLIKEFSPSAIIAFGIGGAYPSSGLNIGDIAIAEKEIYADTGIFLRNGLHDCDTIGIPILRKGKKKYFNEFPLNKHFIKKAIDVSGAHKGTFLTVGAVTGTLKRAKELSKKYNAICENMEGAAISHICTLYDIPLMEIRGISNIVEDRDIKKWNKYIATLNCQKAVLKIIEKL